MKKKLVLFIVLLIIAALAWFGYKSINQLAKNKEAVAITADLAKLLAVFNINSLDPSQKTVLMYFNSDCHYCQYEAKEIQAHKSEFKPYQLAFISFEAADSAINFLAAHDLAQHYLAVEPDKLTATIRGGVPQVFIYKSGKLSKHFKGEVKVEAILKVLQD